MLEKLGKFVIKKYRLVLLFSFIITVISIFFITKLKMNMQFMDLLPKNDNSVIIYKKALKNFNSLDSIIVGIKGNNKNDIEKFLNDVPKTLEQWNEIKSINYAQNDEFLLKNGLITLKEKDLKDLVPLLSSNSIAEFIKSSNDNFEKTYINSSDSEKINKNSNKIIFLLNFLKDFLTKANNGTLNNKDTKRFFRGNKYFISPDNTLGIFIIKSAISIDDIIEVTNFINKLEAYLNKEGKKYNVSTSLTGSQVISRDEMIVSTKDMNLTSTLSIILMLLLFIISFKLIRYSFLAIIPLIMGIIWSMGITYLIFGSLNMLTAMMGAILIGLGIDYSIHIISVFLDEKKSKENLETNLLNVYKKVIRGIITGSITTSIGFIMFSFSKFPGFKEFGIVLGIGIICTLLAAIFTLPALLMVFGKKKLKVKTNKPIYILEKLEIPVIKYKYITLIILIIIISILSIKSTNFKFEKDMMKIEAKGLKSIALNKEIIKKFDFTSDNSIIINKNLKEAQSNYEKLDKLASVGEISSIAQYLPSIEKQNKRLAIIKNIKKSSLIKVDNNIYEDKLIEELYRLENNIIELSDLSYVSGDIKITNKCDEFINSNIISNIIDNLDSKNIQKSQINFFKSLKTLILNHNENIITLNDIPNSIKNEFVGKNNEFITTIYPKHDLWNEDFQKKFLTEIDNVNKNNSGTAKIFIKVVEAEKTEGKKVLIYTVIAIFIVLLFDLKSFKYAIFALLPMLITILAILGIMGWTGFKFDVVNIIGIPLIIGIGVDDGVHLIHRYLQEKDLLITFRSTGKAITLTTLTTVFAFGTLMFAKYRGFIGFGFLLSLGVTLAYLFTLFLLVSLIAIFDKITFK
ncbi:hypothetical protein EV215_0971 [Hypnocyclicus thermotrophus]|uniref:SSD domain-containing protein n=1 Tax=Hypnocyclicus thermotrophus TaxID=1627895 RepID=A0AA46I5U8_9FUSO|nr:MMPL family transporter [Hypnocyclicus thermotrophus]TDT71593.1 hypothetical protein EV215_0971 [Hypnocyclicus thermotrophus]